MMSEAKREAFQNGFRVGAENAGVEDLTSIPIDRLYLWASTKAMQTAAFAEVPQDFQSSWLHGYTSGVKSIAMRLCASQEPADEPAAVEADAEAPAEPEASTSDSAAPMTQRAIAKHLFNQAMMLCAVHTKLKDEPAAVEVPRESEASRSDSVGPRTWRGIVRDLVDQTGSASKLAEAAGVSQATVYGWLKGNKPHTKSRAWLADQVGLEVDDIEPALGSDRQLRIEAQAAADDWREQFEALSEELEDVIDLLEQSARLLHWAVFQPAKLNKDELMTWSDDVCGYLEARKDIQEGKA
jgi:transcriptional regulator with XRE-family HTH domain